MVWNSYQWYGTFTSGMELVPSQWAICLSLGPDIQDHSILVGTTGAGMGVCDKERKLKSL